MKRYLIGIAMGLFLVACGTSSGEQDTGIHGLQKRYERTYPFCTVADTHWITEVLMIKQDSTFELVSKSGIAPDADMQGYDLETGSWTQRGDTIAFDVDTANTRAQDFELYLDQQYLCMVRGPGMRPIKQNDRDYCYVAVPATE